MDSSQMRESQVATGVRMLGEDNGAILDCSAGSGGLAGWIRQTMRGDQTLGAVDGCRNAADK